MSINQKQTSPESIRLLAAMSSLYSAGKVLHFGRLAATAGLALVAPVVFVLWPSANGALAMIGGLTVVGSQVFAKQFEWNKVRLAARVHEEFDVGVLGIPWNDFLVGSRVTRELVHEADSSYKGDRASLANWYPAVDSFPHPLDVLVCQRVNTVWDFRLRREFAYTVGALIVLWFVVSIAVALALNESLVDYTLVYFLPSLPVYLAGIDSIDSHLAVAGEKERLEERLMRVWQDGLTDLEVVRGDDIRQIQDCLYVSRSSGVPIPNFFYHRLQRRYQRDADMAVSELRKQFEEATIREV